MPNSSTPKKAVNEFRIALRQRAEETGYESVQDYLEEECTDSVVTALCMEECNVEPDGHCKHGCPSPLLAAGVI